MATVKLILRSKKNPANITLRFTNGRAINIYAPLNVFIDPQYWDVKNEKIRNVNAVPERDKINIKLSSLKLHLISEYNLDMMNGEIIDREWIDKKICQFFKRPAATDVKKKIERKNVYYFDFAKHWMETEASKWKTGKNKVLNVRAIQQYNSFLVIFDRYQKHKDSSIKLKDIDNHLINDFIQYMDEVEGYGTQTIDRHIGRLRFFCYRAEANNLTVNKNYKERVFVPDEEEVMEPILNENEIEKIFKYDFGQGTFLDNVRDNFIIGLWTGLRISDFNNNLKIENIKNDFIEIRTTKTGAWTVIPLHPMVKKVIEKRYGNLPEKVVDQRFNKAIKLICKLVGIDQDIKGKLFDPEKKRNVTGVFPKYKLVSSHICRRSFATNLFNKVPNHVIQAVGAWKTEAMMLHYIKRTKHESALILRDTWNKKSE